MSCTTSCSSRNPPHNSHPHAHAQPRSLSLSRSLDWCHHHSSEFGSIYLYLSINLKIPSISIHTLIHSDALIDLNQANNALREGNAEARHVNRVPSQLLTVGVTYRYSRFSHQLLGPTVSLARSSLRLQRRNNHYGTPLRVSSAALKSYLHRRTRMSSMGTSGELIYISGGKSSGGDERLLYERWKECSFSLAHSNSKSSRPSCTEGKTRNAFFQCLS